ncbi:MFS transporter [uncultured Amnibacterium sp.]|uniref:MFS transporter n=1 Tax=uncultured Amnibacterium sp. TaxID=1631851 RepID=UPI0035C95021
MLSTGLIAIDSTILATAVKSVTDDLGDFASFPWLFSVYLLAQAVSVPIYSKLADTVGRKPLLLFGIGLFFVGSVLCGFAPTMTWLIVFRAVQGLGAGALLPISVTIAGDIYTVAERAKAQGYLASVWAIASVVGPTLGGVFSQFVSWRWIFFVNVPLCLLAALLVARNYREKAMPRIRHRIDYAGAGTLTVGLTSLLLGLLEGGHAWPWVSWQSLAAFVVAAALIVAFVFIERRAAEPVLPLWVLSRRLLLTTALLSVGVGVVLIGLTSYVPNFLQRTAGQQPIVAGLAVAALTIGWPLAASNAGRLYLRFGFRPTALIGCTLAILGAVALAATVAAASLWLVAAACFLVGLGLGLVATPTLIAAQSSVGREERGVVTGANLFSRSVGSAVGVAVFGAVANGVLAQSRDSIGTATAAASFAVFGAVALAALLTIVAAIVMPKVRADIAPAAADDEQPESATGKAGRDRLPADVRSANDAATASAG